MSRQLYALAVLLIVGGCEPQNKEAKTEQPPADTATTDSEWSPGVGMSYGGKIGMEVAPGIVIDSSGRIGPGFGF